MTTPLIRIPNLPTGAITNSEGNATDDEMTFRHTLISNLQNLFGSEGCVVPTQSYSNMLLIQNNQLPNGQFTCAFGTCLYVPDFLVMAVPTHSIVFCVPDGGGNPLFKRVTLV